ncbi:hypothetical protein PAMA_016227 [Pampus argenteus]
MEERFIAKVMTFPELYNNTFDMREYKDINQRALIWRRIGLQLGILDCYGHYDSENVASYDCQELNTRKKEIIK